LTRRSDKVLVAGTATNPLESLIWRNLLCEWHLTLRASEDGDRHGCFSRIFCHFRFCSPLLLNLGLRFAHQKSLCYKNVTFDRTHHKFQNFNTTRGFMSTRILAALLFSPLLLSCGDEGTISYKEKMPPAVPGNLEAVAGSQQITLTWNTVSNASSYRIYWNTQEITENLKQITDAEGDPNATITVQTIKDVVTNPYVHTGLTPGTTYYYRVAAFNKALSKGLSNVDASAIPNP